MLLLLDTGVYFITLPPAWSNWNVINSFCLIFVLILYCHFFSVKWFRSSSCSNTHMKSIQKLFGLESERQAEAEECLCRSEELLFCNTAHVKAVTQLLMSGRLTQAIAAVSWKTLQLWFSVSSIHFSFFSVTLEYKIGLTCSSFNSMKSI